MMHGSTKLKVCMCFVCKTDMLLCVYIYVYVCIYIYIYIYTYRHIYNLYVNIFKYSEKNYLQNTNKSVK